MNHRTTPSKPLSLVLLAGVLALGACSRDDRAAAEDQADRAIARVEQKTDAVQAEAAQAYERAKEATTTATGQVGDKLSDAAITTAVNAELARDGDLSALAINVDTVDGKVLLKGKAPSQEARERATRLAANVDGVRSVDNRLAVTAGM